MPASFDVAFNYYMDHEDFKRTGAIVPEPRHGRARWGINSRAHPEVDLDAMDTLDKAKAWYLTNTWQTGPYGKLNSQVVANKYYDMAENMGQARATYILQRSLVRAGQQGIELDGTFGPRTLAAANQADPVKTVFFLRDLCAEYYRQLVVSNPTEYSQYLPGWLRRAYS